MRVRQVDYALAGVLEIGGVPVDGGNPAQRLMRRRNVVAIGGEDHQWIANTAKIDRAVVAEPNFALLELVADEQVLQDGDHLVAAEPVIAAPPAFELEKSLALGVDAGEEIGILLPNGFGRVE